MEIEATSLTITWTAPDYDGGSPITGYHAVILHGGKVIENKTLGAAEREYPFSDLKRSTNYTVKVSARNKVFEGDASELKVKIKYEGQYICAQASSVVGSYGLRLFVFKFGVSGTS